MNKERLAVEIAGIRMATPIMGASGAFGFGLEYEDFLDLADVGAVVSKPTPRKTTVFSGFSRAAASASSGE